MSKVYEGRKQFSSLANATALLVVLAAGTSIAISRLAVAQNDRVNDLGATAIDVQIRSSTDTLLVLFLSGSCGACRQEPGASRLKEAIGSYVTSAPRARIVGVGLDAGASQALAYLEGVGHFDEVSAGGAWTNHLSLQYLFADSIPIATVPQLVFVERHTVVRQNGAHNTVAVSSVVLNRYLGLHAISQRLRADPGEAR